ncbi:tetratricopeptide repeat protein [Cyanobacterium sp. uoEpiScrs1]|uniref:tetratricopeptide repeat protein n=1 Tax=Cyanobacterium sp. uoEpiScrs1 TaxID=2976343 RepID=UPI002269CFE1|nr:tetratricopeptide repeat protein [Cyanobacterium sp. uoEpiScrs1]
MQGLLKRIWQWIQEFFEKLFGKRSSNTSIGGNSQESNRPLTDTDYEFLFNQLLEGIAHGWHEGRVLKYFEDLGIRGKSKLWVAWLERFGDKAIASSAPNLQLAARMMRLGELGQSFRETEIIGKKSYEIGKRIYNQEAKSGIWEYEGPDIDEQIVLKDSVQNNSTHFQTDSPNEVTQTLTIEIEELRERLQQDATLAREIVPQAKIKSGEPEQIVDYLLNSVQSEAIKLKQGKYPQTEQEWLNQGLKQANQGDLEGAIISWDKALEINPSLFQGWHNRGSALSDLGRLHEAIDSFDRAIFLDVDNLEAWNSKGDVLYKLEQWEEAITCWDKGLRLQPNYYQGWYNRGSALSKLGKIEEAVISYRKALEIEPGFRLAQSRLNELSERS